MIWGCRFKDKDYITKDWFSEFLKKSKSLKIRIAFSRETKDKKYVQHIIEHHALEYGKFITANLENIEIYVCGSSKFLPQSLDKAFKKCFLEVFKDEKKAEEILAFLNDNNLIKYESFA